MDDAARVAALDGRKELADEAARLALAVPPLLDDAVEELAAREQLHQQVHRLRRVYHRVEAHDVLVARRRQRRHLHLQRLDGLVVLVERRAVDHLHRVLRAAGHVRAEVHLREAALAELLAEHIARRLEVGGVDHLDGVVVRLRRRLLGEEELGDGGAASAGGRRVVGHRIWETLEPKDQRTVEALEAVTVWRVVLVPWCSRCGPW